MYFSEGCTVIWATRRLGDKFFPKCPFGRHEIGRLGDIAQMTVDLQKCIDYVDIACRAFLRYGASNKGVVGKRAIFDLRQYLESGKT